MQTTSQNKGVNDFQRSISANVWLDKTRQPNSRFSLTVAFDKSEEKDGSVKLSGEIKLAHPSLEKVIFYFVVCVYCNNKYTIDKFLFLLNLRILLSKEDQLLLLILLTIP